MPRFSKSQIAGLFIGGAAVGATVALMFAPKPGNQIRRDIRRFSRKAVDQLDDLQYDVREQITEGYDKVKNLIRTA
jgi:gas vesicle protein